MVPDSRGLMTSSDLITGLMRSDSAEITTVIKGEVSPGAASVLWVEALATNCGKKGFLEKGKLRMARRRLTVMVAFLLTCITYTVYGEEELKTDELAAAKRRPPPRLVLEKEEDKRRPPPKSVYYEVIEKLLADASARREQEEKHISPFTGLEDSMEKRRPPPKSLYKLDGDSKRRPPPRYFPDQDADKRRPPPKSVFLRSGIYSARPLEDLVSGSSEDEMMDSRHPHWVYADQSRRRTSSSDGSPSSSSFYTSDDTEEDEFRPPPWVYADRTRRRMPPPWVLQQARLLEAELEREEANRNKYHTDDADWDTSDEQEAVRPPAWVYAGRTRVNKGGLDKTKTLEQYDGSKWRLVPDYYARDVRSAMGRTGTQ
ncbi:uncharacterized protein LOC144861504 isoform X2 [Branchiostoma floridae x Branchiostoma japonicum]